MKSLIKTFIVAGMLITSASATFAGPGAQYFTRRISTTKDAAAVTDNDKVAMACSKCKTITVFEPIASHKVFMRNEKHACPGCRGEITVRMVGSDPANQTMTHSCSKCGDDSAYCCAMSPDNPPTPGMERN
jgi:hypothetical protein